MSLANLGKNLRKILQNKRTMWTFLLANRDILFWYEFKPKNNFSIGCFSCLTSNLLSCLFFLFLLHLLEVNAKYYILLFHLQTNLCSFDNFLPLLLFYFQIFRSNPPVLNPNVFKSSCAINT